MYGPLCFTQPTYPYDKSTLAASGNPLILMFNRMTSGKPLTICYNKSVRGAVVAKPAKSMPPVC